MVLIHFWEYLRHQSIVWWEEPCLVGNWFGFFDLDFFFTNSKYCVSNGLDVVSPDQVWARFDVDDLSYVSIITQMDFEVIDSNLQDEKGTYATGEGRF